MSDKQEFISKIKKMPVEEILRYKTTAINTNRVINVFGILTLLMMLIFPNMEMIIAGAIFIFIFANMSVGISEFLKEISEILAKKKKINS